MSTQMNDEGPCGEKQYSRRATRLFEEALEECGNQSMKRQAKIWNPFGNKTVNNMIETEVCMDKVWLRFSSGIYHEQARDEKKD